MSRVVHGNLDPITGNCGDCGATREAIDDNLYQVCEKFEGPHRLAMFEINRAMIIAKWHAKFMRRSLAVAAPLEQRAYREQGHISQQRAIALAASLDALKAVSHASPVSAEIIAKETGARLVDKALDGLRAGHTKHPSEFTLP